MSLRDQVLRAVESIRIALGDLIVDGSLIRRTKKPYIPGSSQEYEYVTYPIHFALIKADDKEEEGERVDSAELTAYIFPTSAIPQPNDIVSIVGANYRIIDNKPIHTGSEIALSVVTLKPSGQV